jgi:hypothetical protein
LGGGDVGAVWWRDVRLELVERGDWSRAAIEVEIALEDVGRLGRRRVERLVLGIVAHELMRRRLGGVSKKTYTCLHEWATRV